MPKFAEGDKVKYKPIGGPTSKTPESIGTIKSVITESSGTGKGASASEDAPLYKIENANTGKVASIKEASVLGKAE